MPSSVCPKQFALNKMQQENIIIQTIIICNLNYYILLKCTIKLAIALVYENLILKLFTYCINVSKLIITERIHVNILQVLRKLSCEILFTQEDSNLLKENYIAYQSKNNEYITANE